MVRTIHALFVIYNKNIIVNAERHQIPLFHTGHESPESPRVDFFLIRGGGGGGDS